MIHHLFDCLFVCLLVWGLPAHRVTAPTRPELVDYVAFVFALLGFYVLPVLFGTQESLTYES